MLEAISLVEVNLSKRHLEDPDNRRRETQKLLESFTGIGFCQITGIEGYCTGELFEWTKWFFLEVPEELRIEQLATAAFNPRNKNSFWGYHPMVEGNLSHKQGYDLGPDFDKALVQEGNPFIENNTKMVISGMEVKVEKFYEVRCIFT